ncbi:MAG: DUF4153 domain-containing protein [Microscillaceae bacterium]|nr:DUF4153 domain-containing protein [Microscillaceae bacterium]MDW8460101.1 DUF4153 domain-containing protein [Cytophagales bacterium]
MLPRFSFNQIISEARQSAARFPFVLLSAFLASFFWVWLLEAESGDLQDQKLLSAFFCSLLGISWLYSLTILAERYLEQKSRQWLLPLVGAVLLLAYYFSLPKSLDNLESVLRMILFFLFSHLFAAFAPYLRHNEPNGFWQYNETLFSRFLLSVLYAGVLYAGISIALGALNVLFNANIETRIFGQIFGIIAFFFNTWFFLAGVPQDFQALNESTFYPKGLKIFTQYVLLPLVGIYLAILYAYGIKILIEFDLPKGWVVYLILVFSIVGIFSLLLTAPIQETADNKWIKLYVRGFYFALLPLIGLHFVAIGRRISDYGFTEQRYFVLVLGLWLLGICLYFLFSKAKGIKVIPISLAAVALLSSFGFWGAFYVSNQSQLNRLHQTFKKLQVISEGGYLTNLPKNSQLSFEDSENIRSIIRYFCQRRKEYWLQPYFKQPIDSLLVKQQSKNALQNSWERSEALVANLPFFNQINEKVSSNSPFVNFGTRENYTYFKVSGYDYWLKFNLNRNPNSRTEQKETIKIESIKYQLVLNENNEIILTAESENKEEIILVKFDANTWIEQLHQKYKTNNYEVAKSDLERTFENEQGKFYFLFRDVQTQREGTAKPKYRIVWLSVEILIKRKHY